MERPPQPRPLWREIRRLADRSGWTCTATRADARGVAMSFARNGDRLDVWFDPPRSTDGISFTRATYVRSGVVETFTGKDDVRRVLGARRTQRFDGELAPLAVVDAVGAAVGNQQHARYVDLAAVRTRVDDSRVLLRTVARDDPSAADACTVLLATWQRLDGVLDALDVGDTELAAERFRAAIDYPLEPVAAALNGRRVAV